MTDSKQPHQITIDNVRGFKISTRMLLEIALKKGYSLTFYPSSPSTESGVVRSEKDGKVFFFKSTCTLLTSSLGVFAAENKCLTYSILAANNINIADYYAMESGSSIPEDAFAMLNKHSELVVKPVLTNHGDGITIGIKTRERLIEAIEYAKKYCKLEDDIVVQQQVYGKEYRFLVVEGKTIAVAHRMPPDVTGDGISTVEELIKIKNLDPRRGDGHSSILTKIDIEDVRHYGGSELLNRIPDLNERLEVLATSNLSRGGESVNYTDIASKEIKEMAAKAAESTFLGVAGVDIMTNDVTSSSLDGSHVIEVNLTPGLRMHQYPSEGEPIDVAAKIFKAIEKTARPVHKKLTQIGRAERIKLLDLYADPVPVRIDSGATTSSLWASDVVETANGLEFKLFDAQSPNYTGTKHLLKDYSTHVVSSSMGQMQTRYKVKLRVSLKGRRLIASFTLADRSTQAYPVLIGRNILRNKYVVDVAIGSPDAIAERMLKEKKLSMGDIK